MPARDVGLGNDDVLTIESPDSDVEGVPDDDLLVMGIRPDHQIRTRPLTILRAHRTRVG